MHSPSAFAYRNLYQTGASFWLKHTMQIAKQKYEKWYVATVQGRRGEKVAVGFDDYEGVKKCVFINLKSRAYPTEWRFLDDDMPRRLLRSRPALQKTPKPTKRKSPPQEGRGTAKRRPSPDESSRSKKKKKKGKNINIRRLPRRGYLSLAYPFFLASSYLSFILN